MAVKVKKKKSLSSSVTKKPKRLLKSAARRPKRAVRKAKMPLAAHLLSGDWKMGLLGGALLIGMIFWSAKAPKNVPHQSLKQLSLRSDQPDSALIVREESTPLSRRFKEASALGFADRLEYWGELVSQSRGPSGSARAGARDLAALAQGPEIADTAPFLPDQYNCTTFVETVISLSRSGSVNDFFKNLIAVRYKDGQAKYEKRNHFPEADWIPNNVRSGLLKDITIEVAKGAGASVQVASKTIDRGAWLADLRKAGKVSRSIASVAELEWAQPVHVELPYIPLKQVAAVKKEIPSGTVLNIVRQSDDRHPVLITHQGFVIQRNGQTWFRHATRGGKIQSVELMSYLKNRADSKQTLNWPLIGVNLNLPLPAR